MRWLRILVGAFFLSALLCLAVMWVRSYWSWDELEGWGPTGEHIAFASKKGVVSLVAVPGLSSFTKVTSFQTKRYSVNGSWNSFPLNLEVSDHMTWVRCPYLAPMLVMGLGLALILRGKKPRFSLRKLLMAITFVALLVSMVMLW